MATYTNTQKDIMMDKVLNLAEDITGKRWRHDGGNITSEDYTMTINIYDYMDEFTEEEELEYLKEYVKSLIDEQSN